MSKRSYDIEHVLMTTDTVGGVWTFSLDLAAGLARHGVRVTLATMGPEPSERQLEKASEIPGLEIHSSRFLLEWQDQPWEDVDAAADWLLGLAERVRPDVVHLNGYCHAALPWPAPAVVVCHSDVLSWFKAVKGYAAPNDVWGEYARRVREGLQSAEMVIAPTSASLREVEAQYGPFGAARVVHNGRRSSEFGVGRKRDMILTAGRFWDEAKNLSSLQKAAPRLEWPVYVAGDLGESTRAPRTQGIHFLGRLCPSTLGAWMSRSAIYALPARYEPFGLSVLEAALSGCALVLGDIPSLRELWDGVAAFVDPDDTDALVAALNTLALDDVRCQAAGEAARDRAKEYSLSAMACSYLFAYQDLRQSALLDLEVFSHPGVSLR